MMLAVTAGVLASVVQLQVSKNGGVYARKESLGNQARTTASSFLNGQ